MLEEKVVEIILRVVLKSPEDLSKEIDIMQET